MQSDRENKYDSHTAFTSVTIQDMQNFKVYNVRVYIWSRYGKEMYVAITSQYHTKACLFSEVAVFCLI